MNPIDVTFTILGLVLLGIGAIFWREAREQRITALKPIPEALPLARIARRFTRTRVEALPVVDRSGRVTGFVQAEIVRAALAADLPHGLVVAQDLAKATGCDYRAGAVARRDRDASELRQTSMHFA